MDCTAVLCIYCEAATHVATDCPLLSMPKPTAVMYGLCHSDLTFFEIPATPDIRFKHDSGKLGRIRVSGGSLTAQQVVKELEWLVPGDHQWDLRPAGGSTYVQGVVSIKG